MPGTPQFGLVVLFATFAVTLIGGFMFGAARLVPFLLFAGPFLLPTSVTFHVPGFTLGRTTAVTIPALVLMFLASPERLRRLRWQPEDALLAAYVCWAALAVLTNQGAYAAAATLQGELLELVIPVLVGRLYLQDERDWLALARAMAPLAIAAAGIAVLEARLAPFLRHTLYGANQFTDQRFLGFYRPQGLAENQLEFGYTLVLLVVLYAAMVGRSAARVDQGLRTLVPIALGGAMFGVLTTQSRGPWAACLLCVLAPRVLRDTRWLCVLIGGAGVGLFFYMLLPGVTARDVGSYFLTDTPGELNESLLFRFAQIDIYKPYVDAAPIFGHGESWDRPEGSAGIIDGKLLATLLDSGYPGAILLPAFWLLAGFRSSLAQAQPTPLGGIGAGFAVLIGFMTFSSWGDAFVRTPHYLLLGALPAAIRSRTLGTTLTPGAPNWITRRFARHRPPLHATGP